MITREKLVKSLENIIEIFFLLSVFSIPAGPVLKYIFQSLLLLTWIVKLIVKRRIEFNPTSLDYPILLFTILGFASVVINWTSFYQAGKGFSNLLEWFFAFYIVLHLIKRKEQVERFVKVWLSSAIAVTLYGIYQFINQPGGSVLSSFFTLNSYLAQYLILIIPVILLLFLFRKTKRKRIFLGITFLLTWLLLIFTMERGAWLGIIMGLLAMGTILKEKRILIGVPLLLILSLFIFPSFKARAISIFQPCWSLERLYCWRSCLTMVKEHPLIGVGLGNFRWVYPKYMLPGAEVKLLHAHNIFFQVVVEMGIPGLVVFLWLLFVFFKDSLYPHLPPPPLRGRIEEGGGIYLRVLGIGFSVGIIAILVTSLFHDIFHSRQIATLTWYIIGMAMVSRKLEDKDAPGD